MDAKKLTANAALALLLTAGLAGLSIAGPISHNHGKRHGMNNPDAHYADSKLSYSYDYDYNDKYGNYNPYYDWTLDAGWYHDWYGEETSKDWSLWFSNQKKELKVSPHTVSRHNQKQLKWGGGKFSGKITHLRSVTFDDGDKVMLAKIKDSHGHTAVLNLGKISNIKDQNANVKTGEHITASGRSGRLNDKPILVVYSFSTSS